MANQVTRSERIAKADFVIMNMGTLDELEEMVRRAYEWMEGLRDREAKVMPLPGTIARKVPKRRPSSRTRPYSHPNGQRTDHHGGGDRDRLGPP